MDEREFEMRLAASYRRILGNWDMGAVTDGRTLANRLKDSIQEELEWLEMP